MAWPVRRPGLVPPQLSALGRLRPPMRMRSSIMQMPSMGNLALRQPLLGIGRAGLPSAALALPRLPALPQLGGGMAGGLPPQMAGGVGVGGVLSGAQRQRLRPSQFALPGRGTDPGGKGSGSYPIPDASHARNALSRVSQHGTPAEQATVKAKVKAKFPNIGQGGGNRPATGKGGGDVGKGAGGKWISKAISKPGALHRQLGVPQGQKIPAKKLSAAASKGGTLGKRARLAETLKKLNR